MGICFGFWCYFRNLFTALACTKYFDMFNIVLLQEICPLKTEIARFPIAGFRPKVSYSKEMKFKKLSSRNTSTVIKA